MEGSQWGAQPGESEGASGGPTGQALGQAPPLPHLLASSPELRQPRGPWYTKRSPATAQRAYYYYYTKESGEGKGPS